MRLFTRINEFLRRNKGVVLRQAANQLAVRLWVDFRLWRVLDPFLKKREPQTWVFMGGCYNSGTTILREIIGAHPEIASLPREGVEMTDAFPDLENNGWVRMWFKNAGAADFSSQQPTTIANRAMRHWSIWWKKNRAVFLEKSIVHGAWMPVLEQGFPNARFIGVIRNGYCVCEGIRRRARPTGRAREIVGSEVYPVDEVGKQWIFANEALLRDKSQLEHYHEVRYENFTADPLASIKEIFHYIGVDANAVNRNNDGSIEIGDRSFKIKNQNPDSLARLSAEDKKILKKIIGPMLDDLGYQKVESH